MIRILDWETIRPEEILNRDIRAEADVGAAVDAVIAANPAEVEAYRGGKTKLISFFVGQIMRATKGKANPALVNELLGKKL